MSWPIPELPSILPPEKINWQRWLLLLLFLFATGTAVTVLLWPQGRDMHSISFWLLAGGVPLLLFCGLAGLRINQWEHAQLQCEERLLENRRLLLLWHRWANQSLFISGATCFAGGVENTNNWEVATTALPVNIGRACHFQWLRSIPKEERVTVIISLIADRLSRRLASISFVRVLILLDDASLSQRAQWEQSVREQLPAHLERVEVECRSVADPLSILEQYGELEEMPDTLLIVAQLGDGDRPSPFSEGVAGILLRARKPHRGLPDKSVPALARLPRPMPSAMTAADSDLAQVIDLQLAEGSIQNVWLATPEGENLPLLQKELSQHPETEKAVVRNLSEALGTGGPASAWLALALAAEMSLRSLAPQLVAMAEGDLQRLLLCVLIPEKQEEQA